MKLLLVDDEKSLREALAIMLEKSGYQVCCAQDGQAALDLFIQERPDMVILDVMMPILDGFQVCDEIRTVDKDIPILILSAKNDIVDKRVGFKAGADDYLTKPFSEEELLLRVEALIRRNSPRKNTDEGAANVSAYPNTNASIRNLCNGALRIDLQRCEVHVQGELISLTLKEYQIISLLSKSPGKVFSREEIAVAVWGESYEPSAIGIPVYIRHIREKIEKDPSSPEYLQTAWRFGYRLGS